MKRIICAVILIAVCACLTGCGETFHGVSKDIQRMGKGVKTIFTRDE